MMPHRILGSALYLPEAGDEVEERNWTSYVQDGAQNEHSTLSWMCFTFNIYMLTSYFEN